MTMNPTKNKALLFALAALLLYTGGLILYWRSDPGIAAENALMENLQAGALGLCFALMLAAVWVKKDFAERFFAAACALLFLAASLRELDVEKLPVPQLLILLGSGTGRTLLIALPALLLLAVGVRKRRVLAPAVREALRTPVFKVFLLGILLYASGGFFDHHVLGLPRSVDLFMEELCENAATFCLLAGSVMALRGGFTGPGSA